MLASGGALFGNRILSPRSVAALSRNQVGDLFQWNGKQPGMGFGYAVAMVLDPAAANSARGQGAFGWAGAFGTTTWVDPAHEIAAVLMLQQADDRVVRDAGAAIRERHPRRDRRLTSRDHAKGRPPRRRLGAAGKRRSGRGGANSVNAPRVAIRATLGS